jgi:hypothetical protein
MTAARPKCLIVKYNCEIHLGLGEEVLLIIDSASEDAIRARFAADPWSESGLLEIAHVETWTILLDSRSA